MALLTIARETCKGCGLCAESCPTGCMKRVIFPDIPEGVDPRDIIEEANK